MFWADFELTYVNLLIVNSIYLLKNTKTILYVISLVLKTKDYNKINSGANSTFIRF